MNKKKYKDPVYRAIAIIEEIAANGGHDEISNKNMGLIYRLAHIAIATKCRKNHPSWMDELNEMYNEMKESGAIR